MFLTKGWNYEKNISDYLKRKYEQALIPGSFRQITETVEALAKQTGISHPTLLKYLNYVEKNSGNNTENEVNDLQKISLKVAIDMAVAFDESVEAVLFGGTPTTLPDGRKVPFRQLTTKSKIRNNE